MLTVVASDSVQTSKCGGLQFLEYMDQSEWIEEARVLTGLNERQAELFHRLKMGEERAAVTEALGSIR
jgi:hypothetical protein